MSLELEGVTQEEVLPENEGHVVERKAEEEQRT